MKAATPELPQQRPVRHASGQVVFVILGIVCAGLAVYGNSFAGPFIFDDFLSIPQNPTIRHLLSALSPPATGVTVTGRPVLNLSFALNYAISGDAVWSYHVGNLLIHVCAGLALFGFTRRTLKRASAGIHGAASPEGFRPAEKLDWAAFFVALLWTVHPLQTESVTYLAQRAESLMGMFYLLTLYCFARAVETDDGAAHAVAGTRADTAGAEKESSHRGATAGPQRWLWPAGAVIFCALGMGTKEVMVSAPVIVLLYDRIFVCESWWMVWRRHRVLHSLLACTWAPLLVLVVASNGRGGTSGLATGIGFARYAVTQFEAVCRYVWLSFVPYPQIVDYGAVWTQSPAVTIGCGIIVLGLIVGVVVLLRRKPAIGFFGLFFFAILAPTSLIPGGRQTIAEHRVYLALMAPMLMVVLGVWRLFGPRRGAVVLTMVALVFGGLTLVRNRVYQSSENVWTEAVGKRPGNVFAQNNLANILAQSGRLEEAVGHFRRAIQGLPRYPEAHYNLGNALLQLGRMPEALTEFREALREDPAMADAETALGALLMAGGEPVEGRAHLEAAVRLSPNSAEAHTQLAMALASAGELDSALIHFRDAVRIEPRRPDYHNNLGQVLRMTGHADEAVREHQLALDQEPDSIAARVGLAQAWRELHRFSEAIGQFEAALRAAPESPDILNDLGITLLMGERPVEAIGRFEAALRLNPNLAQVHLNLASALESVGRADEAREHVAAAKRLGSTDNLVR